MKSATAQCANRRMCDEIVHVPVPHILEGIVEERVQGRTHEKRVGDKTVDFPRREVWEMRCSRAVGTPDSFVDIEYSYRSL